jgi:hypothetical protein
VLRDAWTREREAASDPARLRAAGNLAALIAIVAMGVMEPALYHGKLLPLLFLVIGYAQAESEAAGRGS